MAIEPTTPLPDVPPAPQRMTTRGKVLWGALIVFFIVLILWSTVRDSQDPDHLDAQDVQHVPPVDNSAQ